MIRQSYHLFNIDVRLLSPLFPALLMSFVQDRELDNIADKI